MLLKKSSYDKDEIITIKLPSGEELVAKVIEDNSNAITVSKPLSVIQSMQGGVALQQSLFTGNMSDYPEVTINKDHIVMSMPSVPEITKHYIATTTGIELPQG
jgi:hypothetical protein